MKLSCLCLLLTCLGNPALGRDSGDAYVIRKGDTWVLGTSKVERTLDFAGGRVFTSSWKNKSNSQELLTEGMVSDELRATVDGLEVSGKSGGWVLVSANDRTLVHGEIELDITLRHFGLEATKSYVVYPRSSIIREWVSIKNVGSAPLKLSEPGFLDLTARLGTPESVDFYWMTGAENQPGSWQLKTEVLKPGKTREFDSYDPLGGSAEGNFVGDGVLARIMLNDRQVWPTGGWQHMEGNFIGTQWAYVANAAETVSQEAVVDVAVGDNLSFIVNKFGSTTSDTTVFDPTIAYADGETHRASEEFSNEQGKNGWRYQYLEGGEERPGDSNYSGFWRPNPQYVNLFYKSASTQWRVLSDNGVDSLFIGPAEMHPGAGQGVARVWVAPKAGRVRITASLVNIGNPPIPGGGRHLRTGSSTYAPWVALLNRENGAGLFVGWDYFGHWASVFTQEGGGSVEAWFRVAGHDQFLRPGESVTTPKAFVGLFEDDLDNAGNECLDWQYRYLWDYSREGWFTAVRTSGWWWKGTSWWDLLNFGVESAADQGSTFRKIFRMADLMSEVGSDVYHRDWGWWDHMGDWSGPNFKVTGAYLRKRGMGQLIYAPIYVVDPSSKVAREHPNWIVNNTLDMSRPEVVEYLKNLLDSFAVRFGPFEFKNDGWFTVKAGGDDTPLLAQDHAFREILTHFLETHPDSALMSCIGGGNGDGYDLKSYTATGSFSDGPVGILRNHWAALILPPDKTSENSSNWGVEKFEKATYRGLLTFNFDLSGDTWDPAKLEGVRELIDIYHYLKSQDVVGRWVHVFRPLVTGDDPTMYFERLSRDGNRGIVIPKRPAPGPVTVRPKGLNDSGSYLVSFQESLSSETRTGADLMEHGIKLEEMIPGELIYLNLPYHPGNKLDKMPPTAPSEVRTDVAMNMGYPGVELTWKPGHDDHWVSYYEVLRNGVSVDKVAKGTYYFDHSVGADVAARYEVRTVDEAGLRSGLVVAEGPKGKPARVLDDTVDGGLRFRRDWERLANLQPAYAGTITRSDQKGASFEVEFEGEKFTWFTKLGEDGGKAEVDVDGQKDEIVDTYSSDDIWGVAIYTKLFPQAGKHVVKVTVLGEQNRPRWLWKGTFVYVDGVRIENPGTVGQPSSRSVRPALRAVGLKMMSPDRNREDTTCDLSLLYFHE